MDAKNGFEIVVREISMNTNYNGTDIASEEELLAFAEKIGFPSHGLIMRPSSSDYSGMIKGITELEALKDSFQNFKSKFGAAYIETDMRALYNPTRMEVIRVAAQKLADKIVSFCPTCYTPGFGVTLVKSGLPCSNCGFPTRSTLCHERQCAKCHYTDEVKFPHGKFTEEPTFCDFCNP
jgi:hypothetical protein